MPRLIIYTLLFILTFPTIAQADKFYSTSGTELIFQFADVEKNNLDVNSRLRFTLFYHIEQHYHFDLTQGFGLFTGIGIRNVGFTTSDEQFINSQGLPFEGDLKIKRRVYTVGFPLAFKVGALEDRFFLYAGGEAEFPFHYKQKIFIDGKKESKKSDWFSNRTYNFLPALFAGIQFPNGINLKFKYYLQDLIRTDYVYDQSGVLDDYDENFQKNQMFHISVSLHLVNKKIKKTLENNNQRFTVL